MSTQGKASPGTREKESKRRDKRPAERKSRPDEGPSHPFVLVHGLLGFGTIGPRGHLEYFRNVMTHLEGNPQVLDGKAKVLDAVGTMGWQNGVDWWYLSSVVAYNSYCTYPRRGEV